MDPDRPIVPNFIGLCNKSKYLGCQDDGVLSYSYDEVMNPNAKFKIEYINDGSGFVHILCCSNNKYWVRSSENENWIVATAKPNANSDRWDCTLFKIESTKKGNDSIITFVHVHTMKKVGLSWKDFDNLSLCLEPLATEENKPTVILLDGLVTLPKYVTLKCNNGKYLSVTSSAKRLTLSNKDKSSIFETVKNPDGSIGFKSTINGKFWRLSSYDDNYWVYCDGTNFEDLTAKFEVYMKEKEHDKFDTLTGDNVVYMRCKRFTSRVCKALERDGWKGFTGGGTKFQNETFMAWEVASP